MLTAGLQSATIPQKKKRYFTAPSGNRYEWTKKGDPTQADIDAIVAYENDRQSNRGYGVQDEGKTRADPNRPGNPYAHTITTDYMSIPNRQRRNKYLQSKADHEAAQGAGDLGLTRNLLEGLSTEAKTQARKLAEKGMTALGSGHQGARQFVGDVAEAGVGTVTDPGAQVAALLQGDIAAGWPVLLSAVGSPAISAAIKGAKSVIGKVKGKTKGAKPVEEVLETAPKPRPYDPNNPPVKGEWVDLGGGQVGRAGKSPSAPKTSPVAETGSVKARDKTGAAATTGIPPNGGKPRYSVTSDSEILPPKGRKFDAESQGQKTGLANQVQEREAIEGVISKVESVKGKTYEQLHEIGKKAYEDGEDFLKLAGSIADGDAVLTSKNIGLILHGKAELQRAVRNAKPGKELVEAQERLQRYLDNVQVGKGEWSNVGRGLQIGADVDTGDIASVLEHMGRSGAVSERAGKQLTELTGEVAKRDEQIKLLEAENAGLRAGQTVTRGKRAARTFDKESVQAEIDSIFEEFKGLKPTAGVKGRESGAVSLGWKDIKDVGKRAELVGRLGIAYGKMGVANLEEVVVAVQGALKEKFGFEVDRQEIVDALAPKAGQTRSEIQKRLASLRSQAKRESTAGKAATKAAEEVRAAKKAVADLERAEAKVAQVRAKQPKTLPDPVAEAKVKEAKRILEEAEKRERIALRAQKKVTETQAEIDTLKIQLETGNYRIPNKKELVIDRQLQNLRNERDLWSGKVKSAIREHEKSLGEKVADEAFGLFRGLKLGADIGVTLRQGLTALGHPIQGAKSFVAGTKAAFSKKSFARVEREALDLELEPGVKAAVVQRKMGLRTSDLNLHPEEVGIGRILSKIPGIGGALNRFQHTYINTFRRGLFNGSYQKGLQAGEMQARSRFLNNVTGMGNANQTPTLLGDVMKYALTSKNYEASRWGTLSEFVRNPSRLAADFLTGKGVHKGALENLKTMGKTAGTMYGLAKAAELQGYIVDWNPTSSDFLKMRRHEGGTVEWEYGLPHYVGGTATDEVWDLSAGVAPRARDIFRMVGALFSGDPVKFGRDAGALLGDTAQRTLSPGWMVPITAISYKRQLDAGVPPDKIKNPFTGFVPKEEERGWWLLAPLIVGSVTQGVGSAPEGSKAKEGVWAFLREFMGTGVNYYPPPKK